MNMLSPLPIDPGFGMLAETLDDLERTRIAADNRLRALTRNGEDKDGKTRGLGLDESHPQVAATDAVVKALLKLEHEAELDLKRAVRRHPLGPWIKATKGIGEKQGARLLAAIGDPYWNTLHGRPRTVSELWAFCGLHTLAVGEGGPQVAARRQRGQRANWSQTAKMRAWNIATACVKQIGGDGVEKSPYRTVYETRKFETDGREHAAQCVRCGPAGKPAEAGSPWSAGHQHADALRIVSKVILRDMWRAARELHEALPDA